MMIDSLSILVVDDNPFMADTLTDILEIKGFEVHTAFSGGEALKILQDHTVDILLTDVRMPIMNGLELYRETRKFHTTLTTILITAYMTDDLVQQGMAEGIKAVLDKPVDIDLLLRLISSNKKIISEAG